MRCPSPAPIPSPATPRWLRTDAVLPVVVVTYSDSPQLRVEDAFLQDASGRFIFGQCSIELVPVGHQLTGRICILRLPGDIVAQCDTYHNAGDLPTGDYFPDGNKVTIAAATSRVFRLGLEDRSAMTTENGSPVDLEL